MVSNSTMYFLDTNVRYLRTYCRGENLKLLDDKLDFSRNNFYNIFPTCIIFSSVQLKSTRGIRFFSCARIEYPRVILEFILNNFFSVKLKFILVKIVCCCLKLVSNSKLHDQTTQKQDI